MSDKTHTEIATLTVGVIDDPYCAWFTAESECAVALRAWRGATGADRELAYITYVAALDREEAAARALERYWSAKATPESADPQP